MDWRAETNILMLYFVCARGPGTPCFEYLSDVFVCSTPAGLSPPPSPEAGDPGGSVSVGEPFHVVQALSDPWGRDSDP